MDISVVVNVGGGDLSCLDTGNAGGGGGGDGVTDATTASKKLDELDTNVGGDGEFVLSDAGEAERGD